MGKNYFFKARYRHFGVQRYTDYMDQLTGVRTYYNPPLQLPGLRVFQQFYITVSLVLRSFTSTPLAAASVRFKPTQAISGEV